MDKKNIVLLMLLFAGTYSYAQTLSLKDALAISLESYDIIKAKQNYLRASEATVQINKRDYLPDLRISAQQNYGTINAQNGPLYGFGGLGVASTSMPLAEQNWNAAFGSLYLANINWDFFTFGQIKNSVRLAKIGNQQSSADLEQEKFQHQIRVTAAYLNLLAMQRIVFVQKVNVDRAAVFLEEVQSLANSELKPGVDASLAQAELSNAKISLLKASDKEIEYSKVLAVLLGMDYTKFKLDTSYSNTLPKQAVSQVAVTENHPELAFKQSAIDYSNGQVRLLNSYYYPKVSLFGVIQGRGSGFFYNYVQDRTAFSRSYADGVGIDRSNYLIGLGFTWNLTSIHKNSAKVRRQKSISLALKDDYNLLSLELKARSGMADAQIVNAIAQRKESPVQVKAASEAYAQHLALYKNGLNTIADLTQSFYALNRAETDNELAAINVWQALLLKASSVGSIDLFINEIK